MLFRSDVAFATIFGGVRSGAPLIRTLAIEDSSRGIVLPQHCFQALSTDAGRASAAPNMLAAHTAGPAEQR